MSTTPGWTFWWRPTMADGYNYKALIDEGRIYPRQRVAHHLADALEELLTERNTLQAQLDSMTEETRINARDVVWRGLTIESSRTVKERRLVTPWVEVPESEGQK